MSSTSESSLSPGLPVKDFRLPDVRGGQASLSEILAEKKAMIVFYRGGWCPLCNMQLSKITASYGEFERRGVEIIAVSNEAVEKGEKLLRKLGPPYPLVADLEGEVLEELGLVVKKRDLLGVVLGKHDFAHPAAILVDQQSHIEWSYRGRNYRDRPSVDLLLSAIDERE
ncbi:MAG: peroxiredoxin family protein [Bradymonadaceae bacterium]